MTANDEAAFSFVFVPAESIDPNNLSQGDVLQRTEQLSAALREAHAYYADAEDYTHFLVLTQACDLVRRGGACKARYITLCAVRPLQTLVERELAKYRKDVGNFPIAVASTSKRGLAEQYLERVLHNTLDGHFFVPRGSVPGLTNHLCGFLALSVSLRVDHYEACLNAKVAQASDIFAAKIGWLAGNLYSRVATPALEEHLTVAEAQSLKARFYDELAHKRIAWITNAQVQLLRARIKEWNVANAGQSLSSEQAQQMLAELPADVDTIAARAVKVLINKKVLANDPETAKRATNFIRNDPEIGRILREK